MAEPAASAGPESGEGPSSSSSAAGSKPVVVLVIGMAGSGKTTLIQRLNSHLHAEKLPGYIINLDPAVTHLPYSANIDIRDTVNYKNVMKQYGLGPNGGILTSCNLFATRFDQVLALCEKPRDPPLRYIIADTPGQIEIFTWSASGQLVTELFASSFPTVVVYVIDTPRCAAPQTFMSNMLQAVSILYKTKLPLLLVFNKVDVTRHAFALTWMDDTDAFADALEADASYAATLSRSLSLVLSEFYAGIRHVGVSALTGEGMDAFFEAVSKSAQDYADDYLPDLEARRRAKEGAEAARREKEMERLRADMAAAGVSEAARGGGPAAAAAAGAAAAGAAAAGAAAAAAAAAGASEAAGRGGDDEGSCDYEVSDDSVEPYSAGAEDE
ncbi:GPN-loop GTPase [Raphidocelis subcapitata]|uniref:GPN-loop GTPase n=1 Tax=Raphidocelis subcapitata TaxID=307507 RepID=A0A2V0NZH3_9CHLO|nr:GPN-loop GTPase [Raphidocelis subcapitata]|eukprot:GBF93041.1 GPN-loop GTPase [Raphidocelis subcapitata]